MSEKQPRPVSIDKQKTAGDNTGKDGQISKEDAAKILPEFGKVGLAAVQVHRDGSIIGGSAVRSDQFGYELEPPVFSIRTEKGKYIAKIQNKYYSPEEDDTTPENLVKITDDIESAAKFITDTYSRWKSETESTS